MALSLFRTAALLALLVPAQGGVVKRQPIAEPGTSSWIQPRSIPSELQNFEVLGHGFENFHQLDERGANGDIYTADWKGKSKRVLIKAQSMDPRFSSMEKAQREARSQEKVWEHDHKAAPEVYGTGGKEWYFIAMELIQGGTLRSAFNQGYFRSPLTKKRLFERLFDLGHSINGAGVHHYDLHMGNVLLRNPLTGDKDDDQGDITAIDYGSASDDDAPRSTGDDSSGGGSWSAGSMTPPVPEPRDDVYMATKIVLHIFFEHQASFRYKGKDWENDMIGSLGTWLGSPVNLTPRARELFVKGLQPVPEKRVSMEEILGVVRGLEHEDFGFED